MAELSPVEAIPKFYQKEVTKEEVAKEEVGKEDQSEETVDKS